MATDPAGHKTHSDPEAANVPAGQTKQFAEEFDATLVEIDPKLHEVQPEDPFSLEKVPNGHGLQEFAVAPTELLKYPASHVVQAIPPVAYEPAPHVTQRSEHNQVTKIKTER